MAIAKQSREGANETMSTEAEIRQRLEPEYVAIFCAHGMSPREAGEIFEDLFTRARELSRANILANIDATGLFSLAETDPSIRGQLEWKVREGVRGEDFQWWWNMPDLERQALRLVYDLQTKSLYSAARESGLGKEEAFEQVRLSRVTFAVSDTELRHPVDAHSQLPVELKARVVQFFDRQTAVDPEDTQWRRMCREAGSANAAIRQKILDPGQRDGPPPLSEPPPVKPATSELLASGPMVSESPPDEPEEPEPSSAEPPLNKPKTSCALDKRARKDTSPWVAVVLFLVLFGGIAGPIIISRMGRTKQPTASNSRSLDEQSKTVAPTDPPGPPLVWTKPEPRSVGPLIAPKPEPRPAVLPPEFTNSIGMKLRLIPAGEFVMGSPEVEEGRWHHEGPVHQVRITKLITLEYMR